jgi:hypothetical protein
MWWLSRGTILGVSSFSKDLKRCLMEEVLGGLFLSLMDLSSGPRVVGTRVNATWLLWVAWAGLTSYCAAWRSDRPYGWSDHDSVWHAGNC